MSCKNSETSEIFSWLKIKRPAPIIFRKRLLNKLAAHESCYWISFITDPITALFLVFWDIAVLRSNLVVLIACYLVGLLNWTFLEYAFHRWIYHKGRTLAHAGHTMHHNSPRMLIGMPWFVTAGFLWGVWYVLGYSLQVRFVLSFMGGLATGLFCYSTFHHILHHFNLRDSWYQELKIHHQVHHRLPNVNFGVTSRFWDRRFGTMHRHNPEKKKYFPQGEKHLSLNLRNSTQTD